MNNNYVFKDNIQSQRISKLGYLLGSSMAVDRDDLRIKLEAALLKEVHVPIKLELYRARYWKRDNDKNMRRKSEVVEAIGISVDSTKVTESARCLKHILKDGVMSPTGRWMRLILRPRTEADREKSNKLLEYQKRGKLRERRTIVQSNLNIDQEVVLKTGERLTIQQAMCKISDKHDKQLFTGVDKMGKTNRLLFAYDKENSDEARGTIPLINNVLRDMTTTQSHQMIGEPATDEDIEFLNEEKSKEQNYLDGIFGSVGLHRYADISMESKKRQATKGDDDSNSSGNMSVLTGVSGVSGMTTYTQSARSQRSAWTTNSASTASRGRGRGRGSMVTSPYNQAKSLRVERPEPTLIRTPTVVPTTVGDNGTANTVQRGSQNTHATSSLTSPVSAAYEKKLKDLERMSERRHKEQEKRELQLNEKIEKLAKDSMEQLNRVENAMKSLVDVGNRHETDIEGLQSKFDKILELLEGRKQQPVTASSTNTIAEEGMTTVKDNNISTLDRGGGII